MEFYPSKPGTFQASSGLARQGPVVDLGLIRLEAHRVSGLAEPKRPCTFDSRTLSGHRVIGHVPASQVNAVVERHSVPFMMSERDGRSWKRHKAREATTEQDGKQCTQACLWCSRITSS